MRAKITQCLDVRLGSMMMIFLERLLLEEDPTIENREQKQKSTVNVKVIILNLNKTKDIQNQI